MNFEYAINGEGFFIVKDAENNRLLVTRNGQFTMTDDKERKMITHQGYDVLNRNLESFDCELKTKEELQEFVAIVLIENPEKLKRFKEGLYFLTEETPYTFSDKQPELAKAMPKVDLAKEFAEMLEKQKKWREERYAHLKVEKDNSLKKKLTFPIRLGFSYLGRFFVLSPLLSFVEIGHNENFPKDDRARKRDIIKTVYIHNLTSAYADCYRSHFYKRANPNDPLWGEVDMYGDPNDPVSRMGW